MKITGITCSSCGASYEMAESVSAQGKPGQAICAVCGDMLAQWNEPKLRVFRLVMPSERRYAAVAAPPAFEAVS
jgi:uncharacterized Zn finger protein